jgi:hypothetical protein
VVFAQAREPELVENLAEIIPSLRPEVAEMPLDLCHLAASGRQRLLLTDLPKRRLDAEQRTQVFIAACGAGTLQLVRELYERLRIAELCEHLKIEQLYPRASDAGANENSYPALDDFSRMTETSRALCDAREARIAALCQTCAKGVSRSPGSAV